MIQIAIIIMYRLILYDEQIYAQPEKNVNAYGIVSGIRQKEKTVEVTLKKVSVTKGTAIKNNEYILIYLKSSDNLKIGQKVNVTGNSKPFETARNPGGFDASRYYHNKGYAYIIFADKLNITDASYNHFREGIRRFSDYMCGIYDRIFDEKEADIMSAIVLGRRERLKEEEIYMYKQGGCMHLFAVSGLHVSMIMTIFLWCIQRLPVGYNSGRMAALTLLVLYGMLTGFSISCIRAAVMIAMSIIARLFGRKYDIPSAVSMAGIIILLINPKDLFSAGFLLSFGSVCSITMLCPYLIKRTGAKMSVAIFPAVSASFVTLPIVLYYYNDAPVYSVLINLIVIPVMSLLFVMGVLCLFASVISTPFSVFFAGAVHYILLFYEKLCGAGTDMLYGFRLKGHVGIGNIAAFFVFAAIILLVIRMKKKIYNYVICILSIIPAVCILAYNPAPSYLNITMLDVGQGDGIYIRTPDNKALMVDGGSSDESDLSRYTLEPFFNYMGDMKIDMWFITHMDSDHYSGLIELLDRRDINRMHIGTLVLADIEDKQTEYAELLKYADCFDNVYFMGAGDILEAGETVISCASPAHGAAYEDTNDYSLVFDLSYGDFDMLFTGDIGAEIEKNTLNRLSECDVLKVAHHGSKNSSSNEFLDATAPDIAVISAGEGNSYGHPDASVLEKLRSRNVDTYVTMDTGAIMIHTDGIKIRCTEYKN